MTNLSPSLSLRRATPEDADAISRVHYEALDTYHEFYAAFFARHPRAILPEATRRALAAGRRDEFLVCVDDHGEAGEVVGFVRFYVRDPVEEEKEKEKEEKAEGGKDESSLFEVKGGVKPVWERFCEGQREKDACLDKAHQGKTHIFIHHLMIKPSHQRRSIGTALLAAALERADARRLPALLISSRESRALYARMGFASLGRWTIDNEAWARELDAVEEEEGEGEGRVSLAERFRGVSEVEDVMVREARA